MNICMYMGRFTDFAARNFHEFVYDVEIRFFLKLRSINSSVISYGREHFKCFQAGGRVLSLWKGIVDDASRIYKVPIILRIVYSEEFLK